MIWRRIIHQVYRYQTNVSCQWWKQPITIQQKNSKQNFLAFLETEADSMLSQWKSFFCSSRKVMEKSFLLYFSLINELVNLRQHDAIVNGEGICWKTRNIPLPDLHRISQGGDQGEVIRTRDTSFFHLIYPQFYLVLLYMLFMLCYKFIQDFSSFY